VIGSRSVMHIRRGHPQGLFRPAWPAAAGVSLHGMNLFNQIRRRASIVCDAGMTTAEYAVGTVAAVAFAVVLYKIVRSPAVSSTLTAVIQSALHAL
jgi:Protein of unknown function (DUF4244)